MTRSIEHSKSVAKINREKEFKAIEILQNLYKIIINCTANDKEIEQYDKAKREL